MKSSDVSAREKPVSGEALPKFTAGSARSLLLTLFGEFVYPSTSAIWTSTLLQAFAAVGVGDKAARQALMRAAAQGWIEGRREGRHASWRLTADALRLIADGSERVRALRHTALDWAGEWLVLQLGFAELGRPERQRVVRALGWLGFGSPAPGLWICPDRGQTPAVQARLQKFDLLEQCIALRGRALEFGSSQAQWVQRAWDLEAIARTYDELVQRFTSLRPRSAETSFCAHVELVNAQQRLPAFDPGLPAALLPKGWPGIRAAERLYELRARWREPAHEHWARLTREG
jgi:phenylacetic acid degradation operon negative regulatory protein